MHDIMLPLDCDDATMPPSSPLHQWGRLLVEASHALDRPLDSTKHYPQLMRDAGFDGVTETIHKWPQNSWAKDPKHKEIGLWTTMNMLEGLQGWSMRPFTQGLGWSTEELEVLLIGVRREIKDRSVHAYWPM
jgi:hypothetical protein